MFLNALHTRLLNSHFWKSPYRGRGYPPPTPSRRSVASLPQTNVPPSKFAPPKLKVFRRACNEVIQSQDVALSTYFTRLTGSATRAHSVRPCHTFPGKPCVWLAGNNFCYPEVPADGPHLTVPSTYLARSCPEVRTQVRFTRSQVLSMLKICSGWVAGDCPQRSTQNTSRRPVTAASYRQVTPVNPLEVRRLPVDLWLCAGNACHLRAFYEHNTGVLLARNGVDTANIRVAGQLCGRGASYTSKLRACWGSVTAFLLVSWGSAAAKIMTFCEDLCHINSPSEGFLHWVHPLDQYYPGSHLAGNSHAGNKQLWRRYLAAPVCRP